MTTLRDYILDCRCPNCGVLMQQRAPKKRPSGWAYVTQIGKTVFFLLVVLIGFTHAWQGDYPQAAFNLTLAVLLHLTWERP